MAEAVIVDGPDVIPSKFFCHQCNDEIDRVLPDFKCPVCNSGFIEEVAENQESSSSDESSDIEDPVDFGFRLSDSYLQSFPRGSSRQRSTSAQSSHSGASRSSRRSNPRDRVWSVSRPSLRDPRDSPLERIMHEFFSNLTSNMELGNDLSRDGSALFLYGSPGDYAFGRGGLDMILSELMNQPNLGGPPPLTKDDITRIPTITIEQSHVDKGAECTVCWENYQLAERVRMLSCAHLFHSECIVPWLELNGTCPVCRSSLHRQSDSSGGSSSSRPEATERPSSSSGWLRGAGRSASGLLSSIIGSVSSAIHGSRVPSSSSGSTARESNPSRDTESAGPSHTYNLRPRGRTDAHGRGSEPSTWSRQRRDRFRDMENDSD